jgi:hypothetical protein
MGTLSSLPPHLRERTRVARPAASSSRSSSACSGGLVVYWQRKVLRSHENAALDVAVAAARENDSELLVLTTVEDRYKHATARRQSFVLEGALAAVAQLRSKGLRVTLHIARKGHRQNLISSLAHRASLIVAEEPFCSPWLDGVHKLLASKSPAEVVLVDADSIVPCSLVPRSSCHRAYAYDAATAKLLAARTGPGSVWPEQLLPFRPPPRPWEGVPLPGAEPEKTAQGGAQADIVAALLAEMDSIDHSVRPVSHTKGGSTHGYARWNAWRAAEGLETYARRRNDALDISGVSRMSAFLCACPTPRPTLRCGHGSDLRW